MADDPVKTAAPILASATPRPDPRATNTVRVLSSGITRPPLAPISITCPSGGAFIVSVARTTGRDSCARYDVRPTDR